MGRSAADNWLYHNLGNGQFEKILSGPAVTGTENAYIPLWADYDNDGDLDLLVMSDARDNLLFRNDGAGQFSRVNAGSLTLAHACRSKPSLVAGMRSEVAVNATSSPRRAPRAERRFATGPGGDWSRWRRLNPERLPTVHKALADVLG